MLKGPRNKNSRRTFANGDQEKSCEEKEEKVTDERSQVSAKFFNKGK
jgi:hypothetical protein